MGDVYIHYKNKKQYIPLAGCRVQENNVWVDGVFYIAANSKVSNPFVRTVKEFEEKFTKEINVTG